MRRSLLDGLRGCSRVPSPFLSERRIYSLTKLREQIDEATNHEIWALRVRNRTALRSRRVAPSCVIGTARRAHRAQCESIDQDAVA